MHQSLLDVGEGIIKPIEHCCVKLMSLGFVSSSPGSGMLCYGPNEGVAVLRSPMAGQVTSQLLARTNVRMLALAENMAYCRVIAKEEVKAFARLLDAMSVNLLQHGGALLSRKALGGKSG